MRAKFYIIQAITNMHVGSGDANYGVIDNLVQRDLITELPTIHGSSLKGALREFFVQDGIWPEEYDTDGKRKINPKLDPVFGANENSGNYRFLSASLLAIPVRSNKKPYFMATAPMVLKAMRKEMDSLKGGNDSEEKVSEILKKLEEFKPYEGKPVVFVDKAGLVIEDFDDSDQFVFETNFPDGADWLLGTEDKNLVIFNDDDFKKLCSDAHLPVIARNKVGDNLWYEQVVPRESRFWTAILNLNGKEKPEFHDKLTDNKNTIHIGANATVGYGFTKFHEVKYEKKN